MISKIRFFKRTIYFITLFISLQIISQETPKNWHLLDKNDDGIPGIRG